ncbi:hypothetical protein M9Y10_015056 [Tritrichomonas musculus]|uniref:Uncharacterized protein n=1 Tax=Tritrichomonas musculus TaxID=1915356 RepID=A0ABR2L311_9EUKA
MSMNLSARATRRSAIMTMKANPPSLVPPVRQKTYIDYDSMSLADKNKCERLIEEFQRTGKIECPTRNTYFKLMVVLREHRRVASSEGDFVKAGEYDILIREISQFFHEADLYKAKAEECDVAESQMMTTRSRLVDVEDKWHNELDRLQTMSARATQRVNDFCDTQMYNYDNKIPEHLPASHSKLSPDLLNLKEREKHMIGCRMFKEAAELHKEFEKRQKVELQRRREEYFKSFEISRVALEKRTQRRRDACQSDWERKIQHAEHMMNKEVKPIQDSIGFMQKRLNSARAEYIGEDDPIIKGDKEVIEERTYHISPPASTRSIKAPRTMQRSTRFINEPTNLMSTKQVSQMMQKQNTKFYDHRWP